MEIFTFKSLASLNAVIFVSVAVYGPITQRDFLHNMGIGVRLKVIF